MASAGRGKTRNRCNSRVEGREVGSGEGAVAYPIQMLKPHHPTPTSPRLAWAGCAQRERRDEGHIMWQHDRGERRR